MKKIIFFLTLLVIVFTKIEVKASIANSGKLYEIYYQESQVGVFASDETYHSMDYNGILVKSNTDNNTYYCIEPESYMSNYSEATNSSHTIYMTEQEIIKNSRLTKQTYEKISLLAYYGYGYKDHNVDHTSKKWYGITQVMMWRILRPDINYVFKTSRYGSLNNNLYLNEIKEIETLVNNHYKLPSFALNEIKLNVGETIILEDTNNVIGNYNIKNSSSFDYEITKNKLKITALTETFEDITLTKKSFTGGVFLFVNKNLQDLIVRGTVPYNNSYFRLRIEMGRVEIKKIDNETKTYNEELNGSTFGLFDMENNLVEEFEIAIETETFMLPYGQYYLQELKASKEYNLNKTIYEVNLTEENDLVTIIVPNSKIQGDLILEKYKGGADEKFVKEESASFEIRDINNDIVDIITTDNKGIAQITLDYGIYKVIQITGSDGYSFITPFEVSITEEKIYKYELKNLKKSVLEIEKKDYSSDKKLPGVLFAIYKDDKLFYEGLTNEEGKLIIENLEFGEYYFKEITPLKYYRLNEEIIKFKVTEDGILFKYTLKNEKKQGNLEFLKIDSKTNKPLENARIMIYYEETNELIFDDYTNSDGLIALDNIEAGTYYLLEKKAPYGYLLNENKIYFEIKKDLETVKVIMPNTKIEMPDTSKNLKENINFYLCFSLTSLLITLTIKKKYVKKNNI